MGSFTDIIQRVADARAENGAEQSRIAMANELLIQNQTNLEAAHGRIMDADVAPRIIQVREAKCAGSVICRHGRSSQSTYQYSPTNLRVK